jgi:hypothetical protein
MALAIFLGLLGFFAALGLKSVWYPILAVLTIGNTIMYIVALGAEGTTDTTVIMTGAVLLSLGILGFHMLYRNRHNAYQPQRAVAARGKSYRATFPNGGVPLDSDEYREWRERTVHEWWRQYPDAVGKMDEPLTNDPFTVNAIAVRSGGKIDSLDLRRV